MNSMNIPLIMQDANTAKEYLSVKLNPIDLRVHLIPIIIGNSWKNFNVIG